MENFNYYQDSLRELATPEPYKQCMFIEVAGQIRKLSTVCRADGKTEEIYVPWSLESIYRKYGKDFTKEVIIKEMPQLDGEDCVPDHINYKLVNGRYLNTYHPLKYQPMEGCNWNHIESLFRHIFDEQYEFGLDYWQLLYLRPMQKLPLLLLVSNENNTGKSTLCNFASRFFGANVTGMNSDGLRNRFSSTWMNKLIVYVEEKLLDKDGDGELLKNLVTAFTGQSESKGKDRVEVPLFAKLIMTTNNENNPIIMHEDDTRVWVRKVPPLPNGVQTDFLSECEKEIPYFMHYLANRELSTPGTDRLWFPHSIIETDAWRRIVNYCRSSIEKLVSELLLDIMNNCNLDTLKFSQSDLLRLLRYDDIKADRTVIKQLLKERWRLIPSPKVERYDLYLHDVSCSQRYSSTSTTGICYEFKKDFLQKLTV